MAGRRAAAAVAERAAPCVRSFLARGRVADEALGLAHAGGSGRKAGAPAAAAAAALLRPTAAVPPIASGSCGPLVQQRERVSSASAPSSCAGWSRSKDGVSQQRRRFSAAAAALPPHEKVAMPSLSPTMTQGNIAKWSKAVGEQVTAGDVLCEIETDKATLSMESMEDGYLAKILLPDGSRDVPVGVPIAIMVDSEDAVAAFADYKGDDGAAPAAPAAPAAAATAAAAAAPAATASAPADLPPYQPIAMPSLSPTMTQGNIAKWRKAVGDEVATGDVLCEIETDKATLEMESMEEGVIAKILYGDGSKDVPVGVPIAIMVDDAAVIPKFADFVPGTAAAPAPSAAAAAAPPPPPPPPPPAAAPAPTPAAAAAPASPRPAGSRIFASPAAKKLAYDNKVDLAQVAGTGPDGRIIKADVEDFLKAPRPAVAAPGVAAPAAAAAPAVPASELRQHVAARMVQSVQTIPHYYLSTDSRVDSIQSLVDSLNALQRDADAPTITLEHVIIKAAALAAKKVPACNSSWAGDYIRQFENVDISLNVYTEYGLVNPVIKAADKKGLAAIAAEAERLTELAKQDQLSPADTEGGTFSVLSVAEYGLKSCSAIVSPSHACALTVGAKQARVLPGPGAGEFEVGGFVTATLSCDHRVVDGAVGAEWLGEFKGYLENPVSLLL